MFGAARSVLVSQAGRDQLAQDAVHDAFRSLLDNPPNYEVENWEAFLVATAKRRALDIVRSRGRKAESPIPKRWDNADEDVDVEAEATNNADAAKRRRCLNQALAALSDKQKRVVLGRAVQERSLADLSAELGVSAARVSQLNKEGLTILRKRMVEGTGC